MKKIYNIEKYNVVIITLFLFGYTLTSLSDKIPNLSIIFCFFSLVSSSLVCKKIKLKIKLEDIIIYFLIALIILSGLLQRSEVTNMRNVILGSLIAYYFGRTVNFNKVKLVKLFQHTVFYLGGLILSKVYFNYFFVSSNKYRVSIGDASVIAVGEMIGIFSIINYFKFIEQKEKKYLFFSCLGIIANFLILSSRSSAFLIIISIIIAHFITVKNKKKIIIVSLLSFLSYLCIFNEKSILLKEYPQLNRFTIQGMLNDPSVVGYKGALGRRLKEGRMYNLKIALNEFEKKIFLGTGIGKNYAHNIFVEVLGALGLTGFLLFLFFIFKIIIIVLKENNKILISLFFYFFLYRQFSFALNAHKTLFFICGILVTKKNKSI